MSEPIRPTAEPPAPATRLTPVGDRAADPDQPRRRVTNVTVAIISILSIIASGYWLQDRLAHVHVSDARIASPMVTVSTRVPGWVSSVEVSAGREIAAGDLVAVIDHRQARLELELAQAASLRRAPNWNASPLKESCWPDGWRRRLPAPNPS